MELQAPEILERIAPFFHGSSSESSDSVLDHGLPNILQKFAEKVDSNCKTWPIFKRCPVRILARTCAILKFFEVFLGTAASYRILPSSSYTVYHLVPYGLIYFFY
jgi:hypothetical protein